MTIFVGLLCVIVGMEITSWIHYSRFDLIPKKKPPSKHKKILAIRPDRTSILDAEKCQCGLVVNWYPANPCDNTAYTLLLPGGKTDGDSRILRWLPHSGFTTKELSEYRFTKQGSLDRKG